MNRRRRPSHRPPALNTRETTPSERRLLFLVRPERPRAHGGPQIASKRQAKEGGDVVFQAPLCHERSEPAKDRTILTPDMFISKGHIYDGDSDYLDCKILPPNLLKQPPHVKNNNVYFYNLFSALKHTSDLDKLRNDGIKMAALSVSVGLYGRWYLVDTDLDGNVQNYTPGDTCF
ncbi:hypothetical protein HPB51_012294 [Rhipicephalus microplus]|uniref:Uncharacterized protein n=1 Tax=Rhipicephalus microplus TaxID=6941 RepID=A0A9J6E9J5_RHIMP|nr:hypothetical protein HPB51_012294 [Rhipicephalus microplus]